jgi:hypothetical protein
MCITAYGNGEYNHVFIDLLIQCKCHKIIVYINDKACGTWLSVSDEPPSLEHLEPYKYFSSRISCSYIFIILYFILCKEFIKNDECIFIYFYATTATRLMGFMPQIYLHGA